MSIFIIWTFFFGHSECPKKKICQNNTKEIYNDKYRHTRDRLFGLIWGWGSIGYINGQKWITRVKFKNLSSLRTIIYGFSYFFPILGTSLILTTARTVTWNFTKKLSFLLYGYLNLSQSLQICEGAPWSWSYGSWIYKVLLVQSVPIITKVESSNPAHGEVYSIQHYVIKFVI